MAQTVSNPDPGPQESRGTGTVASVDKNKRKTGYREDAQIRTTDNPNSPEALIRVVNDGRLT